MKRNILLFIVCIMIFGMSITYINDTGPALEDIDSFDKDYHLYVKLNVTSSIDASVCILSFYTDYFSEDVVFLEILSNNSNRYILSYENDELSYRRFFEGTSNRFNLKYLIDSCNTTYIGIWSIYMTEVILPDNIFIGLYSIE